MEGTPDRALLWARKLNPSGRAKFWYKPDVCLGRSRELATAAGACNREGPCLWGRGLGAQDATGGAGTRAGAPIGGPESGTTDKAGRGRGLSSPPIPHPSL